MIRIFKLVVLLVISQVAFGQAPSNYTNINGRYRWIAGMFDSTFHIPKGSTPSLRTGGSTNSGGLFYNTSDSSVYTYTGTQWIKLRGVIIDTTSLSNRINLKLNISDTASMLNPYLRKIDTTNKYVTQVYKKNASDSVFYVKGGNHIWAFNDSTGSPGGGGGGKIYYFNGGVNMGTFGGLQMYELGDTANTGTAANFTRSTTGNIANFITDPGKPGLVQIPAGVWSVDAWLSETGGGSNHAEIWIEVEKWDGSTITTIATSPIEQITEGATPNLYSWSVTIPTTSLAITDRIIIQFYISNTNGKTVTLYTQNGYVGEVHTTFTTGIGAINGLTAPAQYLVTGTSGTDFNINSSTATHTFNLPTASATNRGALSSANWSTFNSKIGPSDTASMLSPYFRLAGVGLKNTGQTVYADTLLLSTRAWRQKGIDSVAALLPAAISGTTNYIPKFTSSSAIGNSVIYESSSNIGIGTITPQSLLHIASSGNTFSIIDGGASSNTGLSFYKGGSAAGAIYYLGASDAMRFDVNNTERLRISSTGNVGIGTSTIYGKVNINSNGAPASTGTMSTGLTISNGTAGTAINIGTNDGGGYNYIQSSYVNNANVGLPLTFFTGATEKMRLDASGNLGLGVSPSAWTVFNPVLQVKTGSLASSGTANFRMFANTFYDGAYKYIGTGTATQYEQDGYHAWYIAPSGTAGNAISFTQAMTLDASGNLGLGTSATAVSSYRVFEMSGASGSIISLRLSGTEYGQISANTSGLTFATGAYNQFFYTNGSERMRIKSNGDIKIQSGNLLGWSDYSAGSTGVGLLGASEVLQFYSSGSERMRITSGGYLLLGTTTSTYGQAGRGTFEMNGTTDNIFVQKVAGALANYLYSDATKSELYSTNFLQVSVNGAERMRITSGGDVLVATTTASFPGAGRGNITIGGSSSSILSFQTGGSNRGYLYHDGTGLYVNNFVSGSLSLMTNNTDRLWITSGGNVGIGTTSPTTGLVVNSRVQVLGNTAPSSGTGLELFYDGTGAGTLAFARGTGYIPNFMDGSQLQFFTSSSERMRITSGGEILVNTTSDAGDYKLQVNGNVYASGLIRNNYLSLRDDAIEQYQAAADNGTIAINYVGYNGGTAYFRDFAIYDGKGSLISYFDGSNKETTLYGSIKTAAPSAGTAKPWKLGEAGVSVGGANTTAVKVEIDGVVYYLLTAYLPEPEPDPSALPSSGPSASYKTYNKPIPVKTTKDVEIDNLKKEIEELKQLIKNK